MSIRTPPHRSLGPPIATTARPEGARLLYGLGDCRRGSGQQNDPSPCSSGGTRPGSSASRSSLTTCTSLRSCRAASRLASRPGGGVGRSATVSPMGFPAADGQQTRSSKAVEGYCGSSLYGPVYAHNRSRDLGVSHGRWGTANPSNTRHPGRGGPWHARGQGFKSPQLHSHPNRRSPRFLRFGEIPWLVPLT